MADIKYKNGNMYINGNALPIDVLGYTNGEAEQAFGGDVFNRNILTASNDCCFSAKADNCSIQADTLSELSGYATVCNSNNSNNWITATKAIGVSESVDGVKSNLQEIQERISALEKSINTPMVNSLKDLRSSLKTLAYTREV